MNKTLFYLFFLLCYLPNFGQDMLEKISTWTQNQLPESKHLLYTGLVYKNNYYESDEKQHPFLSKKKFETNELHYSDFKFFQIYLNYDIEKDMVVANPSESEQTFYPVALNSEKISYFFIDTKKFVNLNTTRLSETDKANSQFGFAEEIKIESDLILYVKYKKNRTEVKKDLKLITEFSIKTEYFVVSKNKVSEIKSASDLKDFFPEKKELIQTYSDANKMQKNANYRQFLIRLLEQLKTNTEK